MNQIQPEVSQKPPRRTALVLHLWLEADDQLRASLEDIHSGQRLYYSQIEDLNSHINELAGQLVAPSIRKGIR